VTVGSASPSIGLLVLSCALGCATAPAPLDEPPPRYARADGARFEPEALARVVVLCTERAREQLTAEFAGRRGALRRARRALRDRTTVCMGARGWVERER
jgi:hypothetical protein